MSQVTVRIIEKPDEVHKDTQIPLLVQEPRKHTTNTENFFPNLNRKERKLVYSILDVIRENTNASTFEDLQRKIIEAVNK